MANQTRMAKLQNAPSSSTSSLTIPSSIQLSSSHTSPEKDLERATTERERQLQPQRTTTKIVTALDWTGPDDPENPENWSFWKKSYHIIYIGLQCFVVTFASSVYTPSTVNVAKYFNVSIEVATLPFTLYVLGLGAGPIVSAPLSETYGRKVVYLTLLPVSLLFTLGAGCAQNISSLLVCRFFAGFIGSGALAIGSGTNTDLNPPLKRGPVSSIYLLAPFAGPAFGPAVGGYVAQYKPWRWSQWTILMAGLFSVLFGLFQQETYKKIILQRRAKKLNLPPPPDPLAAMAPLQKIKFILLMTIGRPVTMLLTEPIVTFLALYSGFNFGVLFAFFGAFPVIFESPYPKIQVYHLTVGQTGLVYISVFIGLLIAVGIFIATDKYIYVPRARTEIAKGKNERSLLLPPEYRVLPGIVGSLMLPVSLFWFAWTARSDISWAVPTAACILFGAGNMLVFITAAMYQLDAFGRTMGASAMAANGIVRYIFGAVFPLFIRQMYLALGVGWATSLLGFVTVACMPLPWILLKYGPLIRARSNYTPKEN